MSKTLSAEEMETICEVHPMKFFESAWYDFGDLGTPLANGMLAWIATAWPDWAEEVGTDPVIAETVIRDEEGYAELAPFINQLPETLRFDALDHIHDSLLEIQEEDSGAKVAAEIIRRVLKELRPEWNPDDTSD